MSGLAEPDPDWVERWDNYEEFNTVAAENDYRAQRGGVPLREDCSALP